MSHRLVDLLDSENNVSEELRIQAATILGSFAHGKLCFTSSKPLLTAEVLIEGSVAIICSYRK
jgi:hypothetical protein